MNQEFFKKNYFELLGFPMSFEINQDKLKENFRQLQRVVHPDRHANKTDQEKRLAMQMAGHLNTAFETLTSPVNRAAYLLSLENMPVDFETNTSMAPEFLMEQFEIRERIAEKDTMVRAEIEQKRSQLILALADCFSDSHQDLTAAVEKTRQLKFYDKLLKELT